MPQDDVLDAVVVEQVSDDGDVFCGHCDGVSVSLELLDGILHQVHMGWVANIYENVHRRCFKMWNERKGRTRAGLRSWRFHTA